MTPFDFIKTITITLAYLAVVIFAPFAAGIGMLVLLGFIKGENK